MSTDNATHVMRLWNRGKRAGCPQGCREAPRRWRRLTGIKHSSPIRLAAWRAYAPPQLQAFHCRTSHFGLTARCHYCRSPMPASQSPSFPGRKAASWLRLFPAHTCFFLYSWMQLMRPHSAGIRMVPLHPLIQYDNGCCAWPV